MSSKATILRDAYIKLDSLPMSFGLPMYSKDMTDADIDGYIGIDYKDTLRELHLQDVDSIGDMSSDELMIEDRIVYYALRRFRTSASVYFKFSTATDGKTVDKSMIPKMMFEIIKEYDDEFKKLRMRGSGSLWNRGTST